MLPGSSASLTALFHGSHLKLGMCSRRHGEVVLEVRRLQKTDIFLSAKGTGAPQLSRLVSCCLLPKNLRLRDSYARRPVVCVPLTRQHRMPVCNGVVSIWTEQDLLFSDESRFSLSSDCRRQLIWRASGTAYRPENIQKRTDIRHAVSWCGSAS
ncbi:hypothetical protein TNCV_4858991 [Trichonephila clavipes]|nr:hypothetical protein TNCV_4858991 [Trichonephila clavipes]